MGLFDIWGEEYYSTKTGKRKQSDIPHSYCEKNCQWCKDPAIYDENYYPTLCPQCKRFNRLIPNYSYVENYEHLSDEEKMIIFVSHNTGTEWFKMMRDKIIVNKITNDENERTKKIKEAEKMFGVTKKDLMKLKR